MVRRIWFLAALVALLLTASACADEGPVASPVPTGAPAALTPSPAPGPHERPEILVGVDVVQLGFGSEVHIPGDVALIVETGCFYCDGPTTGLIRVYTRPDGSPVVDTLLDPEALGLGPRRLTTPKGVEEEPPYITGFALGENASEIMVSICVQETCGSGGLDAWSPDSETELFRSTDGGVTWEQLGKLDIGGFVVQLLGEGRAVVGTWDVEGAPLTLRAFPGLEEIAPPQVDAWPLYVRDNEIIWRSADGRALLLPDRSTLVDFGPEAWVYRVSAPVAPSALLVVWNWRDYYYLSLVEDGQLVQTYEYDRFLLVPPIGAEKGLAIGNAETDVSLLPGELPGGVFSYLPAVFDLTVGAVSPILDPFAQPDFPRGRNHIVGVMRGFFARVEAPGSCLNVRAEPSLSAPVVACAADSVLLRGIGLRHAGETVEAQGVTWLHVLTPDGREGWVSKAFLGP